MLSVLVVVVVLLLADTVEMVFFCLGCAHGWAQIVASWEPQAPKPLGCRKVGAWRVALPKPSSVDRIGTGDLLMGLVVSSPPSGGLPRTLQGGGLGYLSALGCHHPRSSLQLQLRVKVHIQAMMNPVPSCHLDSRTISHQGTDCRRT